MDTRRRHGLKPAEWAILAVGIITVVEWLIITAIFAKKPTPPPPVPDADLAQMLETRYGPTRDSEDREEWIVRDFFQDVQGGVFVDISAGDYKTGSNTYKLETQFGWSGLAVDALEHFAQDYQEHRPRTTFVARFVSDTADADATIYVPKNATRR